MNYFKKIISVAWLSVFAIISMLLINSTIASANGKGGEAAFKEYCAACHAGGGNIVKADKTLARKDREKNGVKTVKDIVGLMRKPGEGMTTFDKKMISDKEAKAIAEYIVKTFK